MLAVAVASDVRRVMQCHVFGFMEKVYKQKEGGFIGSQLTGIVAKVRMILWIRRINSKCLEIGLTVFLSTVFVDDSVFSIIVDPGIRYCVEMNILQFSEKWKQEDEDLCDDGKSLG